MNNAFLCDKLQNTSVRLELTSVLGITKLECPRSLDIQRSLDDQLNFKPHICYSLHSFASAEGGIMTI